MLIRIVHSIGGWLMTTVRTVVVLLLVGSASALGNPPLLIYEGEFFVPGGGAPPIDQAQLEFRFFSAGAQEPTIRCGALAAIEEDGRFRAVLQDCAAAIEMFAETVELEIALLEAGQEARVFERQIVGTVPSALVCEAVVGDIEPRSIRIGDRLIADSNGVQIDGHSVPMMIRDDAPDDDQPALVLTVENREPREPTEFSSIHDALAFLDDKTIAASAEVHIRVAASAEIYGPYSQPIVVRHRDGARIHIIGDEDAEEPPVVLEFHDSPGLVIEAGARLGRFSGILLRGDGVNDHNGVTVEDAGYGLFRRVVVEQFGGHGFVAEYGAVLRVEDRDDDVCGTIGLEPGRAPILEGPSSVTARANGKSGLYTEGGRIVARKVLTKDNGHSGCAAGTSGHLVCDCARVLDNGWAGVSASGPSAVVSALKALAMGNGYQTDDDGDQSGLKARYDATISAPRALATRNRKYGFSADYRSHIYAKQAHVAENGVGNDGIAFQAGGGAAIYSGGGAVVEPHDGGDYVPPRRVYEGTNY